MLYRSYIEASIVEHILETMLKDNDVTVFSYPWLNGREKGFTFSVLNWENPVYVFVAECRNSDSLTVTIGKYDAWDMITDEEYNKREYFDYGSYAEVADRVLEILGVKV